MYISTSGVCLCYNLPLGEILLFSCDEYINRKCHGFERGHCGYLHLLGFWEFYGAILLGWSVVFREKKKL